MSTISLRPVNGMDLKDLWVWRNHPEARKGFFNDKPVSWREHQKWFFSKTGDRNTKIYIGGLGKAKIGVIRFEIEKIFTRVSVNLNPEFFARGLGSKIIKLGTEEFVNDTKTRLPVIAEIKKENLASQKAFAKAGYKLKKEMKDRMIYEGAPQC